MAVAVLDRAVSTVDSFREMQEEIGVRAANILYVSDAARLSMSDLLYNTDNHEISDNRNIGGRHNDEENENTERGRANKANSGRRMSEALSSSAWYDQPSNTGGGLFSSIFNRAQNTWSDLQQDPLAAASNIGESFLNRATFGLMGRSAEQIEEDIRTTGEIGGSTERTSGTDRLMNDISRDPGGTALNVGESTVNLLTFGFVGRSREQIAEQQALAGNVRGEVANENTPEVPTAQPRNEDLIASNQRDVTARPEGPTIKDLFDQLASAYPPAQGQAPSPGRQLAAAPSPGGMG